MAGKFPYPSIIVRGNPEDGYDFIGPFDDPRIALAYAERKFSGALHCTIIALIPPDDDEKVEVDTDV